jgi:two-component system OmpR family sensor kinase
VSPGSYIRSAARGTYSAYRTVPIRWRLAGGSAALTFVILAGFALIVGVLTTRQVRGQFTNQVTSEANYVETELGTLQLDPTTHRLDCGQVNLGDYASPENAQIRIYDLGDGSLGCAQRVTQGTKLPGFPPPGPQGTFNELGYLVDVQQINVHPSGDFALLYARPYSDIEDTLAKVRFFLILGVLGGTIAALLAGLATAARAMRPISELSDAAREIERTRDPSRRIPHPEADDEIADLARTLEGMLGALDDARGETESMLERQREFVADASHELRTPLTSVLANLELLADELDGEQADSAKSALRSTRRMRRLVGDLLLLARADAKREPRSYPTDLREVLLESAAELGPVAESHVLLIDARAAVIDGVRDDLHRMTLNLLENAVRHTPPGTEIRAATSTVDDRTLLVVEDHGPGIAPELGSRVFDRFIRGAGDGGRGSGLGLAIVRAVAESHHGTVTVQHTDPANLVWPGTRFTVAIPTAAASSAPTELATESAPVDSVQTSTTTGSTIGRRRNRS